MIGLIAIIVIGVLLLLGWMIFRWVYKFQRRKDKSSAVASTWGFVAVVVLSLPITWDAIPTWIAFKYYANKEAGLTVFKTLDQWKTENPGMADTLEPYGKYYNDPRSKVIELSDNKSRWMLNARFAYDKKVTYAQSGIRLVSQEITDIKTAKAMIKWVSVGSGNSGGLVSGGDRWWKFWLLHSSSTLEQEIMFEKHKRFFQFLESK
jgi:heme/copper-type cytochrome/quinol oxidase subunit 2